jgi:hypothetical protein
MQEFSTQSYEAISAEEYLFRTYKSAAFYEEKTLCQLVADTPNPQNKSPGRAQ